MTPTKSNFPKYYIAFFPVIGIGMFVLLYIIAAFKYPGGSWDSIEQSGFSFWNNYLCDLLDSHAVNGAPNDARLFARAALGILCASLLLLWYHLPKLFVKKSTNLWIMRLSGFLALIVMLFIASETHDSIVRIAGVFGVIAIISLIIELHKIRFRTLQHLGIFCVIIFFINYFIYETGSYIHLLPVIQKITFSCFILWFVLLAISLYQHLKSNSIKDS
ncbi:hypothetical protein SAMN04515667_1601 [Formosa sp. Hel1_31_208]|uniref:hypothetical protein n=1 Tax=Formosa sp. Hel1_31_208 TaxID=1798225 RepID=UPI00087A6DA6|nr:hypothetical protein [Formosa sp. Hel1_31_208]SDS18562.1 hypothetical protein SAMN04515667_1601 [Formosa sp. Hel1_31_208]